MTTVASAKARGKRVLPVMWRLRRNEKDYRERGIRLLAGADEVGVGPLAGPLVAAAVIMPVESAIRGVDDSKKVLSPQARGRLSREILAEAVAVGIGMASAREIERVNVYQAGLRAMARAVRRLDPAPELLLVDARVIPGLDIPQEAHKKGDATFYQIACASLVAKVFRDALMRRLDRRHPGYGFARHMGYPTPEHHEALRRLGPCPIHRRNTAWVMECDQGELWPDVVSGEAAAEAPAE